MPRIRSPRLRPPSGMTSIVFGSLVGSSTTLVPAKRFSLRSHTTWSSVTIRLIERTTSSGAFWPSNVEEVAIQIPWWRLAHLARLVVGDSADTQGGAQEAKNKPQVRRGRMVKTLVEMPGATRDEPTGRRGSSLECKRAIRSPASSVFSLRQTAGSWRRP